MSEDDKPAQWARGVKGEIDQRPKRFYKFVETTGGESGFGVTLDGRPLRTPAGAPLRLPTEALAEVVAEEWRTQEERIDLLGMFATRLANVAIDRTPPNRAEMVEEIARYAGTDAICYPAEFPASLRERQDEVWGALRAWSAEALGVRLLPAAGLSAHPQPQESLDAVKAHAAALDDFALSGLAMAAGLYGSAVLALAVVKDRISAVDAYEASRIEEAFQQAQWGVDAEAEALTARRRNDAAGLDRWFGALKA
ncbi:MAG: ATP12 family protein [Hyphomonadaceae bacterium]